MPIALLTDFGTRDYFVGAVKGAILSVNENAQIIDITHEIEPHNIAAASFTLRACYRNFPKKTIFVAVVDPGVGSDRRAILVETDDYFFIAPDNGLLSFLFGKAESFRVFELTNKKFLAENISATFHGRDVFAPIAAHLSNEILPNRFGAEIADFVNISSESKGSQIIHIDRFGNLITNLKREDLPDKFYLEIGETRIEKSRTFYAEAAKSEIFMIIGSAGFLEIVAFQDSAEKLLKAERGQSVYIKNL